MAANWPYVKHALRVGTELEDRLAKDNASCVDHLYDV